MESIYIFKNVPSSVKRQIYIYLIGIGTPSSKIIKKTYDELYEANKKHIFINKDMIMTKPRDIGFMGIHEVMKLNPKSAFSRIIIDNLQKDYKGKCDICLKINEDYLLPDQFYEIYSAQLFYLYNCTNTLKFNIMLSLLSYNQSLEKLFKYKYLQLKSEEPII
jgi:hypothetical protein